jgi:hypothetical protein
MTVEEMRAQLNHLRSLRAGGVRQATFLGQSVTYVSDAEMARAIADLERRIAAAEAGRPRRRVFRPHAVKDL